MADDTSDHAADSTAGMVGDAADYVTDVADDAADGANDPVDDAVDNASDDTACDWTYGAVDDAARHE